MKPTTIIILIVIVAVAGYFVFKAWLRNKVSELYGRDTDLSDISVPNLWKMYKAINNKNT